MFIKSSGCQLTELSMNKNYVGINYKKFIVELKKSQIHQFNKRQRETICNQLINNEKYFLNVFKPSIESSMHSIIDKKFVIHLHPIQFNVISSLNECESIVKKYFRVMFYKLFYTRN